ncbi:MAG: hypothetical protein DRO76_00595 [Candidatus Altiarchaeales archaeon]|nr:MAG: hypothetical protein DRO76_00595 [Candidatus Altiarchaeales archaeon]
MINMGSDNSSNNSLLNYILEESMSKDHVIVMEKLSEPKHDEDIAAELNLKATIVRTLLNELHAKNLVEYERTKNKKTGWYTYLWKKREDKIDEFIQSYLTHKLDILNKQLQVEKQGITFACSCNRVSLEEAIETNFICPRCNETFIEFDNEKIIRKLESEIRKINKLLK